MTPRPSRGRTRTRSASGGFWSASTPPCFRRSGRGPTQPLGEIREASAKEPHEASYVGNLRFFTDVVTLLEDRSERARGLVEERSLALLRRVFSRVFSHLQEMDPTSILTLPSRLCP